MTKTARTKAADPFAAVRKNLVETVDAVTDGFAQVNQLTEAEFAKAKDAAAEHAEKTRAAVQANVDAAVAAGEIVTAGVEKANALVYNQIASVAENRVAAAKKMINATSPQDVIGVQTALFEAEQLKAKVFVQALAKLTQSVANDALKPVQAQVAENLKAFSVKAA